MRGVQVRQPLTFSVMYISPLTSVVYLMVNVFFFFFFFKVVCYLYSSVASGVVPGLPFGYPFG